VIFTGAMFVPGEKRVENGTLGTVIDANAKGGQLTIQTGGLSDHHPPDRLRTVGARVER
jgi:hypothetical protein